MKLVRIGAVTIFFGSFLWLAPIMHAEEQVCAIRIPTEKLQSGILEVSDELEIRKTALTSIMLCAIQETENLSNDLQTISLKSDTSVLRETRAVFLNQLASARSFYQSEFEKIGSLTIYGSKFFAETLRSWRTAIYIPRIKRISNYIAWLKTGESIAIGETRLSETTATVRTLRLHNNPDVAGLLLEAKRNLTSARTSHNRAEQVFENLNVPDDSLELTRVSLISLSAGYQNFFDIGEMVKEMLTANLGAIK